MQQCHAEARGTLLEVAVNGGWDAVLPMLDYLVRLLDGRGMGRASGPPAGDGGRCG